MHSGSHAQPSVRRLHRRDPRQRQLLRHPVLHCREHPFRPVARRGRIGRDMLDAQLRQRPPNLGRLGAIHLAAGLGRVKIMTAAIIVQA